MFPPKFIPATPQFGNYAHVFQEVPFALWVLNSAQVVALSVTGSVLSAALVGYSFARFRWRGRDLVFGITLATMMLPAEVTLIPTYLLFKYLGWLNSIKPLWVPAWFGGGAFAIFLFRQFIMTIPRELDEAATIDGANPLRILTTVLLPLMQPVLATMSVISFIGSWNDFMGPLIYLNSPKKFTVALGLRYFQTTPGSQSYGVPTQHYLMVCCVLSALPIIILFFAAQKYFVQGIVMSGLKG
ncbi:MAG: carbohydrate ABC transporter permease [Chloroflexi bacterium]|nr:carbohydrate ABC transporter permease [Chloroflexota bacterium]